VNLLDMARSRAQQLAEMVGHALAAPALLAAPKKGACRWCDYTAVCGEGEEARAQKKQKTQLQMSMETFRRES
jgi:hypothetical protein